MDIVQTRHRGLGLPWLIRIHHLQDVRDKACPVCARMATGDYGSAKRAEASDRERWIADHGTAERGGREVSVTPSGAYSVVRTITGLNSQRALTAHIMFYSPVRSEADPLCWFSHFIAPGPLGRIRLSAARTPTDTGQSGAPRLLIYIRDKETVGNKHRKTCPRCCFWKHTAVAESRYVCRALW